MSFKTGAFKQEGKSFRNFVSIGDGDAERIASLGLQAPALLKGITSIGGDSGGSLPSRVKSVKLVEAPTCMQLISEQEMLQSRLADVVAYPGCLDLRSRLSRENGSPEGRTPRSLFHYGDKGISCQLVQFSRPAGDSNCPDSPKAVPNPRREPAAEDATVAAGAGVRNTIPRPDLVNEDVGTSASNKMNAFIAARGPTTAPLSSQKERPTQLPALNSNNSDSDRLGSTPNYARTALLDNSPWKVQGISDTSGSRSPYHGLGTKKAAMQPLNGRSANILANRVPQHVRS